MDNNLSYLQNNFFDPITTSKGRLIINVYNNSIAKPIEYANVRVFKKENQNSTIEILKTNCSGKTLPVNLNCPPKEYSLIPTPPSKPYEEYSIEVSSEGFLPTIIDGIQIFPDEEAIQDVILTPNNNLKLEENIIKIANHTLWGEYEPKILENEIKDFSNNTGLVILSKVVLPETVIVHEGSPKSNGKNYYVSFKNYIKNVVSSEIYATWPDATIRANTIAIISFTLNRIYTEWYRNYLKNFTITSSTAYDQAFFYGRNIYSRISSIVDELFSTYIVKSNMEQPLLAQYCDGRKVSCPNWLTQWGSKELGEKGYKAIDILKHFYGHNISLKQAQKINGIPSSYPGSVLKYGSRSQNVKIIQTQLNGISKNFPAIPKINVDGIYGNATTKSVKKFQSIFGLNQTGVVDYATWYKISGIYVAVKKLA